MQLKETLDRFHPTSPSIQTEDLPTHEEINALLKGTFKRIESHPNFKKPDDETIQKIISNCLKEAYAIEAAARNPERWNITEEDAKRQHLTIVLSAAGGTYAEPRKGNFFGPEWWSRFSDRIQSDAAAILSIMRAGVAAGRDFSAFTEKPYLSWLNSTLNALRAEVRQALEDSGQKIVYVGTQLEGKDLFNVLRSAKSFVPKELVRIIRPYTVKDTVTQLQPLADYIQKHLQSEENPDGFITKDAVITVVMSTQAVRFFRLKQVKDLFPPGIELRLFPVASSDPALDPFTKAEISGTIANLALGLGDIDPLEYELVGDTSEKSS